MQKKLRYGLSALALGAALLAAGPSLAQFHHSGGHGGPGSGGGPGHFGGFRGGPIHTFAGRSFAHFGPADRHIWAGGRWSHGWHGGHFGWWWLAGGGWFFYPYAVYPYPDYVSTAYYDDGDYAPAGDGGGSSWYHCDNPNGYYPYVQTCNGPWRPVPATPPGMQQGGNGYGPADAGPRNMGPPDNGPGPDDDNSGPPPGGSGDGPPDQGPPPPPPGH
jgi:hypothetical protein